MHVFGKHRLNWVGRATHGRCCTQRYNDVRSMLSALQPPCRNLGSVISELLAVHANPAGAVAGRVRSPSPYPAPAPAPASTGLWEMWAWGPKERDNTGADTPSATVGDNGTPATTSVRESCQQVLQAATCDGEPGTPLAASSTAGPSTQQGCRGTNKNRHCPCSQQQQGPRHSAHTEERWASGRAPASNAGSGQQGQPQQQVAGAAADGVSPASAPAAPHQDFRAAKEELPGRSS